MHRLLSLLASFLAGSLVGQDRALPAATASNAFAWDLYRTLPKHQGNLCFSPYSISAALAMTRAGAAGQTAEQMDAVLHSDAVVGADHRELAAALQPRQITDHSQPARPRPTDPPRDQPRTVPTYELRLASALWGQEKLTFEKPFLTILDQQFGAPLSRVDFRQTDKVRDLINAWVEEHTENKIKNIVPPGMPTPDTRLVLGNAIYFKASWAESFKAPATQPAPFTTLDGEKLDVPMMRRVGHYRYAATDDVQVVEIPYRGRDASMFVVLPKKPDGLPALEAQLDNKVIGDICDGLGWTSVQLQLPRFECTSAFDLARQLSAMGMPAAFDPQSANFTGMTRQERLFIGAVLHKTFIDVDEKGTEAAAATLVMLKVGGARRQEPVPFVADHPFLFFIKQRKTGCILFAGRVTTPEVHRGDVRPG